MSQFKSIKEEAFKANLKLVELKLVLLTFGNASALDRSKKVFAIKPSGVPYEKLKVEDMVVVDFESNVIEGDLNPSSDTPTHAVLYKNWDDIGGIVHTHSTYATGWAQAQKDIPILGTTHADYLAVDIPCTPEMSNEMIEGKYEYETGVHIINSFKERELDPEQVPMTIVSSHGPFTWGKTVNEAVYHSAILEEIAKMAWIAKGINPKVQNLKSSLIRKHHDRKHGDDSYYGQGS